MLESSCRADSLVEKGEKKWKIIREGCKEEKEKYHTTSKILPSLNCYRLNVFGK
jgi:hypothetical protein